MAINDNKITQVEIDANNVKSISDTPTGTSTEIKNIFDKLPELIATRFNSLIDNLKSIVNGSSGADNIGIGTDTGLTGVTVKAQIKELKDGKVETNAPITGATKCKVTYDAKGLVTSGADLVKADLPTEALLSDNLITAITESRTDKIASEKSVADYAVPLTNVITAVVGSRTDKIVSEKALADYAIATGAGDMLRAVFDPTGKNQDIFAYADTKVSEVNGSLSEQLTSQQTSISNLTTNKANLSLLSWEKISSIITSTDTQQVDFTNISSSYRMLKIIYNISNAKSYSSDLNLVLNSDNTAKYYDRFMFIDASSIVITNSSSTVKNYILIKEGCSVNCIGEITICNTAIEKTVSFDLACSTKRYSGAGTYQGISLINSISLICNNPTYGTIKAGSEIILMGVK